MRRGTIVQKEQIDESQYWGDILGACVQGARRGGGRLVHTKEESLRRRSRGGNGRRKKPKSLNDESVMDERDHHVGMRQIYEKNKGGGRKKRRRTLDNRMDNIEVVRMDPFTPSKKRLLKCARGGKIFRAYRESR